MKKEKKDKDEKMEKWIVNWKVKNEISELKDRIQILEKKIREKEKEIGSIKSEKENLKKEYEKQIDELKTEKSQIENEYKKMKKKYTLIVYKLFVLEMDILDDLYELNKENEGNEMIINMLNEGKTIREISESLRISSKTVVDVNEKKKGKEKLKSVMEKIDQILDIDRNEFSDEQEKEITTNENMFSMIERHRNFYGYRWRKYI